MSVPEQEAWWLLGSKATRWRGGGEDGEMFAGGRIDLACAGESDGRRGPGGGRSGCCLLRFIRGGTWAVLGRSAEFSQIGL